MIITKTITIRVGARDVSRMRDLGYDVKCGSIIEIPVEHLSHNSKQKVEVQCDKCGVIKHVEYWTYVQRAHDEYYCGKCAPTISNKEKRWKTLSKRTSFAQHNINKCGENFWQYWSDKNTIDPHSFPPFSIQEVWINCIDRPEHGAYKTQATTFSSGRRCPMCKGKIVHISDSLATSIEKIYGETFLLDKWSDKNVLLPYEFTSRSGRYVWLKCENKLHKDYRTEIKDATKRNYRCPACSFEQLNSFLQEKVANYIHSIGYEVANEYQCSITPHNPNGGRVFHYDNEVLGLSLIIEVHGIQHYTANGLIQMAARNSGRTVEEEFAYQQWKDQYKKDYAISHGYSYLEIPYYTEDDDSYKTLIDDAIRAAEQKLQKGA